MGFNKILLPILLFAGVSYGARLIWRRIEEKKKALRLHSQHRHAAAVVIQEAYRRYAAQKSLKQLLQIDEHHRCNAAVRIQAAYRGFAARKNYNEFLQLLRGLDGGSTGDESDDDEWPLWWVPTQFFFPRPELGLLPVGLENLWNTCYLSSVLQCLTFTPPLAQFCLTRSHSSVCPFGPRSRSCPVCLLEVHVYRSHTHLDNPYLPLKPGRILDYVCKSRNWDFKRRCQADAHELLVCYIGACTRFLKQHQLEKSASVFQQMFGGRLLGQVECRSCGTLSYTEQPFMDISVDIIHSSSLLKSIRAWFTPEVIDGYNCANCKLSPAKRSCFISKAPNILFIHLKRSDPYGLEKIDKHITFEEYLDLSAFISQSSRADPKPIYRLYAIIVHSGSSLHSGHYYALIKALKANSEQAILSKKLATIRCDLPFEMVPFSTSDLAFQKPKDKWEKFISLVRAIAAYAQGFSPDPLIRKTLYLWNKL